MGSTHPESSNLFTKNTNTVHKSKYYIYSIGNESQVRVQMSVPLLVFLNFLQNMRQDLLSGLYVRGK